MAGNERPVARTSDEARREIDETRQRLATTLDRLGDEIEGRTGELLDRVDVLKPVRRRVRMDPIPMAGLAFGIGVLAGLVRSRRRGRRRDADGSRGSGSRDDGRGGIRHSLARELRSVVVRQVGKVLVGAIAGVVTNRLSRRAGGTEKESQDASAEVTRRERDASAG